MTIAPTKSASLEGKSTWPTWPKMGELGDPWVADYPSEALVNAMDPLALS